MNGHPDGPHPDWGFWAAQHAVQAVANAAAIQTAQANANALAMAQATAVAQASTTRQTLLTAAKAHLDAVLADPTVATNPNAVSHIAAAEQILGSVT